MHLKQKLFSSLSVSQAQAPGSEATPSAQKNVQDGKGADVAEVHEDSTSIEGPVVPLGLSGCSGSTQEQPSGLEGPVACAYEDKDNDGHQEDRQATNG